jgi:hypothetical protein
MLLPELRPLRLGAHRDLLRVVDVALLAFVDRARWGRVGLHRRGDGCGNDHGDDRAHRVTGGVTVSRTWRSTGAALPSRVRAETDST